jgi:hypothetical protein
MNAKYHSTMMGSDLLAQSRVDNSVESHKTVIARDLSRVTTSWASKLLIGTIVVILVAGWRVKEDELYSAQEGAGYWLGVAGGVTLILQFLYPLRKKLRLLHRFGSVKAWFNTHRAMGLIGPVLILFHSNFKLHALNSNVALFSMILVMLSGLIGSYIYIRVNYQLRGHIVSLERLQSLLGHTRLQTDSHRILGERIKRRLNQFEVEELAPTDGLLRAFLRSLGLRLRAHWLVVSIMQEIKHDLMRLCKEEPIRTTTLTRYAEEQKILVHNYVAAVSRVAEFSVYRRLFSLWHILHVPLFIMMVLTAIVHVVSVHMY